MEIDRKRNSRFSEWETGSVTSETDYIGPEETGTPILGIGSSELHNEFCNSAKKSYAKHKQCIILMSLLQHNYRNPELESQLEEAWLRDYKDNKSFLMYGPLY
ncbi:hypothetical protein O181_037751 [Austropuccinia psidii MF-1]|uniref:Uncharacterized protein n=1 Tax=Austropuccinia psidii MF-1 TaxID=1389203 RepID=A0A9Q3DCQ9_9BASI|nr:hypothetical protein [Austropuccinia psidii MF-1]